MKKDLSQLDPGGVLKSAHELENHSLRVSNANSSVPPQYSRVSITYNASGSITNALFYLGTVAEKRHIHAIADSSGSLNNTYFPLYSENDESLYHVWYNVSGGGTDPAPVGSKGIEIPIETNDSAAMVAFATHLVLECFKQDFEVEMCGDEIVVIANTRMGLATNTVDMGTGFGITTIDEGAEKLIKSIDIPYDGTVKYIYNAQERKFEAFPVASVEVIIGEVDLKNPNVREIINKSIATKNTEVTETLPDDTKRYTIRVREGKARLKLADAVGETSTKFRTIERGFVYESGDIDIANGTVLYLNSTQDNIIVEIEVWRRV
jgi:hypothetical protein